jgi:DNA-binding transcriptional ArsR family regulator
MTTTPLAQVSQIYKALAHPTRIRLLAALRYGPLCACQMTVVVELAASTVSEHLAELRNAGLIADRKDGRWVEYRLSDSALHVEILDPLWHALDEDSEIGADALLVRELRGIPVEQLCGLDLSRLRRPRRAAVLTMAQQPRAENGARKNR